MNKNGEITRSAELNSIDEEARLDIILFCKNIPAGSQIAFSADKPDIHGNPVKLDKVEVPSPSGHPSVLSDFQAGTIFDLPAGYSATVTYSCWPKGEIPQDFSMEIRCVLPQ